MTPHGPTAKKIFIAPKVNYRYGLPEVHKAFSSRAGKEI